MHSPLPTTSSALSLQFEAGLKRSRTLYHGTLVELESGVSYEYHAQARKQVLLFDPLVWAGCYLWLQQSHVYSLSTAAAAVLSVRFEVRKVPASPYYQK